MDSDSYIRFFDILTAVLHDWRVYDVIGLRSWFNRAANIGNIMPFQIFSIQCPDTQVWSIQ